MCNIRPYVHAHVRMCDDVRLIAPLHIVQACMSTSQSSHMHASHLTYRYVSNIWTLATMHAHARTNMQVSLQIFTSILTRMHAHTHAGGLQHLCPQRSGGRHPCKLSWRVRRHVWHHACLYQEYEYRCMCIGCYTLLACVVFPLYTLLAVHVRTHTYNYINIHTCMQHLTWGWDGIRLPVVCGGFCLCIGRIDR